MRKLIFLSIIIFALSSFDGIESITDNYGMPVDSATGKITYVDVVKETGKADELYDRAYAWAKKYFVNISSTIKKRDKEKGLLAGTTRFKVHTTDKKGRQVDAGIISYDFTINFKDNRYRIKETNFRQVNNSGNAVEKWFEDTNEKAVPLHREIFKQIDAKAKAMIKSFKAGMKPVEETSDEW